MIRLGTVVMGAENVQRAAAFWVGVLEYNPVTFDDSENDFTILVPPSGQGTRVALQRAETPVQEHPRVHIDLITDNAAEQSTEIERLIKLGATRPKWTYGAGADFVVLADTEGNRFCVVNANTS